MTLREVLQQSETEIVGFLYVSSGDHKSEQSRASVSCERSQQSFEAGFQYEQRCQDIFTLQ